MNASCLDSSANAEIRGKRIIFIFKWTKEKGFPQWKKKKSIHVSLKKTKKKTLIYNLFLLCLKDISKTYSTTNS